MSYMPKDIEVLLDPSSLIMKNEVELVDCMHTSISPIISDGTANVSSLLDVNVDLESCF